MKLFFYALIALIASTIGAISGIGGGVIIKPTMDAISGIGVATISFMSGCTVLAMSVSSFIRSFKSKTKIDYKISVFLAFGACIGGYLGKIIFENATGNISLIQAIMLLLINVFVFLYIKFKAKIKTLQVTNPVICVIIGLLLGMISSFLGIGGGPINIAVLYFFFSMLPKTTAMNSLFIIMCSQATSFFTTLINKTVPDFNMITLILMCLGGVLGAIIGGKISKKLSEQNVENFFMIVLSALILLNVYNIIKFSIA